MTISARDNFCCGSAGLAIGSTNTQFSTARAVTVVINGRAYNVAADATQAFSAATALAAKQVCAFFILADASGVLTSQQSAIKPASDAAGDYTPGAFEWPDVPDKAVVGAVKVASGASAFTPGTTALTGGTVTVTYIDAAFDYGKPIAY